MNPFYSIIIALYNKEKFIYDVLLSVYKQSYINYEVIIIDDKSTDQSYRIVIDFVSNHSDRRCLLYQNIQNMGVGYSRNRGIDLAVGNYIIFLDADDILNDKEMLSKVSNYLLFYPIEMLILTREYMGRHNKPDYKHVKRYIKCIDNDLYKIINKSKFAYFGRFPFGGSASSILRKDVLMYRKFDENERMYEDWLFFLDIYLSRDIVYFLSSICVQINIDPNSLSRSLNNEERRKLPKVYNLLIEYEEYFLAKKFFNSWLRSNINTHTSFKSNMKIISNVKKEIIYNIDFSFYGIYNSIIIIIKIILSIINLKL